jgi:hypothetical protein
VIAAVSDRSHEMREDSYISYFFNRELKLIKLTLFQIHF